MLFKSVTQKVMIEGMMCEHCAMRVKTILEDLEGVKSVQISLKEGLAEVKSSKGVDENLLKDSIEKAGYKFLGVK